MHRIEMLYEQVQGEIMVELPPLCKSPLVLTLCTFGKISSRYAPFVWIRYSQDITMTSPRYGLVWSVLKGLEQFGTPKCQQARWEWTGSLYVPPDWAVLIKVFNWNIQIVYQLFGYADIFRYIFVKREKITQPLSQDCITELRNFSTLAWLDLTLT